MFKAPSHVILILGLSGLLKFSRPVLEARLLANTNAVIVDDQLSLV